MTLTASNDEFNVEWETVEDIPASVIEPGGLFWSVELWVNDNVGYQFSAALDGESWTTDIFDFAHSTNIPISATPAIMGNRLAVSYPIAKLENLQAPFAWNAATEWGDVQFYNDVCPGGGGPTVEPEERATFRREGPH